MSISDKIKNVQNNLEKLKRNHKFKKANKERQANADYLFEISKCGGDLEVCRKEFFYTIKEQSENIRAGREGGFDTIVQEQQLWDAAIGYMLVKDATYALKTIATYDSVVRAYELLDIATKKMTGEKTFPFAKFGKKKPDRSEFGYVNSAETVEAKGRIVDGFFDKLILNGDIEKCINDARAESANSRTTINNASGNGTMPERLNTSNNSQSFDDQQENINRLKKESMSNIAPPNIK